MRRQSALDGGAGGDDVVVMGEGGRGLEGLPMVRAFGVLLWAQRGVPSSSDLCRRESVSCGHHRHFRSRRIGIRALAYKEILLADEMCRVSFHSRRLRWGSMARPLGADGRRRVEKVLKTYRVIKLAA